MNHRVVKLVSLTKSFIPKHHYVKIKRIYQYLFSLLYLGSNFECPLCGGLFRKFLSNPVDKVSQDVTIKNSIIGFGFRANCWCPRCLSMERERLLYLYLRNFSDIFSNNVNVLHFAPEQNLEKIFKNQTNINYISVDLFRDTVMAKMDIQDIGFKENSFDYIFCSHVLNFVSNDRKALSELYRVLKTAGVSFIIVPFSMTFFKTYEDPLIMSKEERKRAFGDVDLRRIYGKDLEKRLAQAGFKVEIFVWENFREKFGGDFNKFGLLRNESIFIGRKGS